jgi:hypothetical protein
MAVARVSHKMVNLTQEPRRVRRTWTYIDLRVAAGRWVRRNHLFYSGAFQELGPTMFLAEAKLCVPSSNFGQSL